MFVFMIKLSHYFLISSYGLSFFLSFFESRVSENTSEGEGGAEGEGEAGSSLSREQGVPCRA